MSGYQKLPQKHNRKGFLKKQYLKVKFTFVHIEIFFHWCSVESELQPFGQCLRFLTAHQLKHVWGTCCQLCVHGSGPCSSGQAGGCWAALGLQTTHRSAWGTLDNAQAGRAREPALSKHLNWTGASGFLTLGRNATHNPVTVNGTLSYKVLNLQL